MAPPKLLSMSKGALLSAKKEKSSAVVSTTMQVVFYISIKILK